MHILCSAEEMVCTNVCVCGEKIQRDRHRQTDRGAHYIPQSARFLILLVINCVCVCVCVCVCMSTLLHMCVCVCVCVHLSVFTGTYVCAHAQTWMTLIVMKITWVLRIWKGQICAPSEVSCKVLYHLEWYFMCCLECLIWFMLFWFHFHWQLLRKDTFTLLISIKKNTLQVKVHDSLHSADLILSSLRFRFGMTIVLSRFSNSTPVWVALT